MSIKRDGLQPFRRQSSSEDKDLMGKIQKQKQLIARTQEKIQQLDFRIKKVVESNTRNSARLIRHRARLQQLFQGKDHPEILLAFSGIMNEYVQTFMISHNFEMNVDVTTMNPDQMSYEQLLQLGDKIGKVSKGLSKEQIEKLNHVKITKPEEKCPICCTEFEKGQVGIQLRCRHVYHEECITEWFKDENNCPICKQSVIEKKEQEKPVNYKGNPDN